jgi:TonB-linked SusC/RagA family outer membrane protein
VTDTKGNPVPFASVLVKGSSKGVTADEKGNFKLQVNDGATIVVNSQGFVSTEVPVTSTTSFINISLESSTNQLNEIVVTGYTIQRKKDATSSIARIGEDKFTNSPNVSILDNLKGNAAGVTAMSGSGQPGSVQAVRIRGINSISSANYPLYVIDGIIVASGQLNGSNQDQSIDILSNLNPDDVESVNILKDASAIALYGARGANGVIVITTKKGKAGKTEFTARAQYGITKPNFGKLKLMNSRQFWDYERTAIKNAGYTDAQVNQLHPESELATDYNWLDAAFQDGHTYNADISARGGTDKTRYYLSGGVGKQDGILIGSNLRKYNLVSNIEQKVSSSFTMGLNLNLSYNDIKNAGAGNNYSSPILGSVGTAPIQSPYKSDGTMYTGREAEWFGLTGDNFLYSTQYNFNNIRNFRTLAKLYGEYKIFNWLKLSQNLAIDWTDARQKIFQDARTSDGIGSNGSIFEADIQHKIYTTQTSLSGNFRIAQDHSFDYLAMLEYSYRDNSSIAASGKSLVANDKFRVLNATTVPVSVGGSTSTQAIASYIGNLNYSFKDKYNLNVSLRRDGASNFTDHKTELFYAFGGAWRIIQENFMKQQNIFSDLKLRASYGTTGNLTGLNDFIAYTLWAPTGYDDQPAIYPSQLGNNDLRWEKTTSTDIGVEMAFLKSRLSVELDLYNKSTNQQLFNLPISSTSGFTTQPINLGKVNNKGIELTINSKNIESKNFEWSTSFNVSYNKNKLIETKNNQDVVSGLTITRVGESLSSFYLRKWAGVDPANGDPLWYTADGKTTNSYSAAPRFVVGQALPRYVFGLTNTFSYKGISASILLYGVTGNKLYNQTRSYLDNDAYVYSGFNHLVSAGQNFWTKAGDNAERPKPIYGGNKNSASSSTRFLEDGKYLRIKNIKLGYTLPRNLLHNTGLQNVTVYGQAENLVTWTKYTGMDPEMDASGNEFFKYPVGKVITFGLNIGF